MTDTYYAAAYWLARAETSVQVILSWQAVLDDYGAQNEAEFFAVATESFFEKPRQRCRQQALFLLKFPECDQACRQQLDVFTRPGR